MTDSRPVHVRCPAPGCGRFVPRPGPNAVAACGCGAVVAGPWAPPPDAERGRWLVLCGGVVSGVYDTAEGAERAAAGLVVVVVASGRVSPVEVVRSVARWVPDAAGTGLVPAGPATS